MLATPIFAEGKSTSEAQAANQEDEIAKRELDVLTGRSKVDTGLLAQASQASHANLVSTANRVEYLRLAGISYTAYDFHVADSKQIEDQSSVVMTVTEYISLTIAGWETDSTRPQYTEYEQRRILRFSKTDTGALILQSDELPFQFSELSGPPIDSKPTAANTVFLPVISERIGDSKPSEHSNTQLKPLAVQANKSAIVSYALTWALGRNPSYRDFDTVDCTNFVSQAMYACRRLVGRPGFHAVGWGVVVQQLDNPDPHMD